ncbi:MAG: hypothetical protein OEU54_03735 [Gemmatimonadota bacterium]|nr:hypothetical protein [Gemmatimonadota bacterium]
MSTVPELHEPRERPSDEAAVEAMLAFLPIHKRALGVAVGLVGGTLLFAATVFALVVLGGDPTGLRLVGEYFYGYEVSWPGAFIGFFWAFVASFVFAWFAAFVHNFAVATSIFIARTREELRQTRDFLDHI